MSSLSYWAGVFGFLFVGLLVWISNAIPRKTKQTFWSWFWTILIVGNVLVTLYQLATTGEVTWLSQPFHPLY